NESAGWYCALHVGHCDVSVRARTPSRLGYITLDRHRERSGHIWLPLAKQFASIPGRVAQDAAVTYLHTGPLRSLSYARQDTFGDIKAVALKIVADDSAKQ